MNRLSIVGDAKGKGSENGEGKGKGKGGKNANRCPVALLGGPLGPLNFSVAKNCHIKVALKNPNCGYIGNCRLLWLSISGYPTAPPSREQLRCL